MKKPMPPKPGKMKMRMGKPVAKAAEGGLIPPNGGRRGGGVMGVPIPGRSTGPANGGRRGGGVQGKPIPGRSTGPANGGRRGGGIMGKPKGMR